jgi:hypothetical protein
MDGTMCCKQSRSSISMLSRNLSQTGPTFLMIIYGRTVHPHSFYTILLFDLPESLLMAADGPISQGLHRPVHAEFWQSCLPTGKVLSLANNMPKGVWGQNRIQGWMDTVAKHEDATYLVIVTHQAFRNRFLSSRTCSFSSHFHNIFEMFAIEFCSLVPCQLLWRPVCTYYFLDVQTTLTSLRCGAQFSQPMPNIYKQPTWSSLFMTTCSPQAQFRPRPPRAQYSLCALTLVILPSLNDIPR